MASSLYDGLDDVELSKGGSGNGGSGSGSGWVLGGVSSTPGATTTTTTTGIGRLVAAASGSAGTQGAYSSMQLMQSHMAAKRAQGRRGGGATGDYAPRSAVAPVVDLHRRGGGGGGTSAEGSYRFNQMTGKVERVASSSSSSSSTNRSTVASSHFASSAASGLLYGEPSLSLGVPDEYNPLCPNDYEELARQKREKRKTDDRARDSHGGSGFSRRPNLSGSDSGGSSDDSGDDRDDRNRRVRSHHRRRPPPPPPTSRAAIAPPSSLLEDVVVAPGSDFISTTTSGNTGATADVDADEMDDSVAQTASGSYGINVVAAKMMARMGYRQGQGLGKEGQGMSSALVVEKTSRRGGKIIHEKDLQRNQDAETLSPVSGLSVEQLQMSALPPNATQVVLLQNMCGGPSEVDDYLEPETAEECAKYGNVITCMIYQMPDAGDGPEAVRIFVEFENAEAAARAVLGLNGRFFGGRVVQAGFYDAERFRSLEFSDPPLI